MADNSKLVTTPLTDERISGLSVGDHLRISGVIYTARDAAHKRLIELADRGEPLPIDLKEQIIYYVGPTPPRPGAVIGSAGPTTAMRLDPYTPRMLELGLKGIIGKGASYRDQRQCCSGDAHRYLVPRPTHRDHPSKNSLVGEPGGEFWLAAQKSISA